MESATIQQLERLGFQSNEAKVYLALLNLGQTTVTIVSKAAKINRTTGYDVLERLCSYGVANRSGAGKKRIYIAEPPHRLRQFLDNKKKQAERRLEELGDILPDLQ